MTAIQKITSAAKTFSGKPLGITSKVLGAATIAAIVYDCHVSGKEQANCTEEKDTARRISQQIQQYKQMEGNSATTAKLKRLWYDTQQDFPLYTLTSRAKGYADGASKTLFGNLALVGLSAVALKCKKVGKIAGVLLAANGIKTLCYDVFGIGSKKNSTIE